MPDNDSYSLRQTTPPSQLTGKPYLKEDEGEIALHFDFRTVQSTMSKTDPDALSLGYTRTMMAFLLFQPEPARIAMIGLGGGSLAKYCLRHLPGVDFTAVEISRDIIALRDDFRLPPDGERFRVVCADGADYIRAMSHSVDVLLLDGFDLEGQPRQLCSTAFYDYCFARLNLGGVLVVNLWAADEMLPVYLGRLRECFDGQVVVIDAAEEGNQIAFACKLPTFPPGKEQLRSQALALEARHPVGLTESAQKIRLALEKKRRSRSGAR